MRLYSTSNKDNIVDLREAVIKALPEDKGLYMPSDIERLNGAFFKNLKDKDLRQIAYEVSLHLIGDCIPSNDLRQICDDAINFPSPVKMFNDQVGCLELFHGPSMAFKDFGARYMSRLMSYFNKDNDEPLTILVATSGDTGGAVAAGFYDTPGIEVIILYPSGKVSDIQEKQLTTLGKNITACEIDGNFDDCQAIVKRAFLDKKLEEQYRLSSANSINIARLIPQSFYYFDAYRQVGEEGRRFIVSVPSGNFGNLTAGLMARKMGLPIDQFIAATNVNKIVPDYLATSIFSPKKSIPTISNAMDVGNPSNFSRMLDLFNGEWLDIKKTVKGYSYTDMETRNSMLELNNIYGYMTDPHGAIGYAAIVDYFKEIEDSPIAVFLGTAHYGKFIPIMKEAFGKEVDLPSRLKSLHKFTKVSHKLSRDYEDFCSFLLARR